MSSKITANTMAKYTISFSMCMSSTSMPELMPSESKNSSTPMTVMNTSARIFISVCLLMKSEMASMNTIMMMTANTTAMIMMIKCCAKPTAVITESIENTTSMTMMVATAWPRPIRCSSLCSSECSAFSSVSASTSRSSSMPL